MIKRELEKQCRSLAKKFPILTITGPRQSGKTTLAKTCFPKKPYVNLEDPDQRQIAIEDPRGFLNQFPNGAILDEIQRTPEIPSYLQSIVDNKNKNGLFILTGSQQFEISQTISQSLAGRSAILKLLPFSIEELLKLHTPPSIDKILFQGLYPRLHNQKIPPHQFFTSYFETYIQRDVRQLSQIENLHIFEKFVRLLASNIGQLINYNSIANAIGVSHPTIKKWVSLLEASFVIYQLNPFYRNIKKRLIKTPKIYFYDTGLACYLMGIENFKQLQNHISRGYLFENFIIVEFLKKRFNRGLGSNLFFFRDRTGHEVDLIIDNASKLDAIEIKSSSTFHMDFMKNLIFFKETFPKDTASTSIIYTGKPNHCIKNIECKNWNTALLK